MDKKSIIKKIKHEVGTPTPLYTVLLFFITWWSFVISKQVNSTSPIFTWEILTQHQSPLFWQILWYGVLVSHLIGFFYPELFFKRYLLMAETGVWLYTGIILSQGEISMTQGMCYILTLISIWCFVRLGIHNSNVARLIEGKRKLWEHQIKSNKL